jgi:ATP-dependent Clp protease adapter protein ClpS
MYSRHNMLFNLIVSTLAITQCDAFVLSRRTHRHHPINGQYPTTAMLSHLGSHHHLTSDHPSTGEHHITGGLWELGLLIDSNPTLSLDYTSRCINQVVGISEDDSLEVATLAYRHGIALIEEFPHDVAVSFKAELGRHGISCEIVPANGHVEEGEKIIQDADFAWELGLLRDPQNTRDYISRCLCQVVGLSEADAYKVTGEAERYGVSLIDEFHPEHAEHYMAELSRLDIAVCCTYDK